jgi:hypothetical protein
MMRLFKQAFPYVPQNILIITQKKFVLRTKEKKNQDYVIKTCYSEYNVLLAIPISLEVIYGGQIKSGVGISNLHHYCGKK